MIGLFEARSEISLLPFLRENAARLSLIGPPAFLAALPAGLYDAQAQRLAGVPVLPLEPGTGTDAAISALAAAQPQDHVCVLAAPLGEDAALRRLRAAHPGLRVVGLGAGLLPARVAQCPEAIFRPVPPQPACTAVTLIFAPPRSGSSLVADLVGHITGARVREHLRKPLLDVLAAPYVFDRVAALQGFMSLIAVDGRAGSKLISHFVQTYLAGGDAAEDTLEGVRAACATVAVKVIVIARGNTVAQAVSGYLAMQRGVWHLQSQADAERLEAAAPVAYDFEGLLRLYRFYRRQDQVLDAARERFPAHLALEYDRDIAPGGTDALGSLIASFLGLPWVAPEAPLDRRRLANAENAEMCRRFDEEFRARFGVAP